MPPSRLSKNALNQLSPVIGINGLYLAISTILDWSVEDIGRPHSNLKGGDVRGDVEEMH